MQLYKEICQLVLSCGWKWPISSREGASVYDLSALQGDSVRSQIGWWYPWIPTRVAGRRIISS